MLFPGQFFGATIFLLSLSSAMTVLIMKLHFSGEHGAKVPRWIRTVVLVCLAKVVRMHKTTEQTYKVSHERSQYVKCLNFNLYPVLFWLPLIFYSSSFVLLSKAIVSFV